MTEFVPQYYRMDPETEEAIFGRDLKNGMIVLVEAPSRRADLNAFDPDSNPLRPDCLPEHVEFQALRYNRWAKVTKLEMITEGKDKVEQILFIAEYDDGLRATQKSYMTSGWLVKKDSLSEASVTDKSINQILRDATRKKVGVAQFIEKQEKLTDTMTAASLKAAGYSNVAISQITRLTEKKVQEILERHAETPFLKSSTQKNLMGDLASGRLTLEAPPFQDGRDVTAVIKPGANYLPEPLYAAARFMDFMKENCRIFEGLGSIKLPDLAQMFNGEYCTREDNDVRWQLNHEIIERLAKEYWGKYDELRYEFSDYLGFGLTAGEIMARGMSNIGAPGEFPPCTCNEHGPCPTHQYLNH